ncbi:type II secretion system protein GspM [uncultured Ramlibacter sp.]|uniref:type II secretion system protein GspM n=1 Tax=uncultured Ramlibacter sp. TaxID=260755 RepID=UPI002631FD88|nr:type II secretion system protein GspM [uncultured Ramlibacter sp.]
MKAMDILRARWQQLAPREKTLVAGAAALVGASLLWWVALAPALATLRSAPAQHRTLDTQLQHMLGQQALARQLQAQPRLGYDEALHLLETSVKQALGTSARIAVNGDRVTLTLAGTAPGALAQWLAQARANARALPAETRLTRNAAGQWDGTVVLNLPSAR